MAINIEIDRNKNESTANVIRRFTKRVKGSGIITKTRKSRYFQRAKSSNVNRTTKLLKLERKENYDNLVKLGKIQEVQYRSRR